MSRYRTGWIAALVFVCPLVAGCASRTDPASLPLTFPETFSDSGVDATPSRWWTVFNDPRLNAVVDSALASNFDLMTAWQRLRAANAAAGVTRGELFPDLDASARADVSDGSGDFERREDFELGLSSEYEVDLWGRIRSSVDAERYRAHATRADFHTAALSLSAEIVRTWFALAEARDELALVEAQIETNETVLQLLKNRFGTGLVRSVDILRQSQLVASTREQKTRVESRLEVLEHRLAVLSGRTPQEGIDAAPERLPDLPLLPQTGVPARLVERRPDVRRALGLLRAADADLAAAVSNQYPRLSLTASISTAAESADDLFDDWFTSLVGNLVAPVLRGGELRAEVDRNEALVRQRLYDYGQAVLVALQEVEDALVLERKQIESIELLDEQVELANQSYEQLRIEYLNGASNYLDVLVALDEVQELRRNRLAAGLTLLEYRVALYRALAGAFETPMETMETVEENSS